MKKILQARTTFSNDEMTDTMSEVVHDIDVEINGRPFTLQLLAQCPIDAINKVRQLDERECLSIIKTPASSLKFR